MVDANIKKRAGAAHGPIVAAGDLAQGARTGSPKRKQRGPDLDPERIWRGCNFHSTCFGGYFGDAAIRLAEQMASARATAGDDFYEVVMHQHRMPPRRGGVI